MHFHLCRGKGHFASSCTVGNLSNPILIDDDAWCGDGECNVLDSWCCAPSGPAEVELMDLDYDV